MRMCERLADLAQAAQAYSSSFDAGLLSGSEASRVVTLAATIKNIAASLEARAATRAEDCGAWARSGDKSPAHHLARVSGTTVGEAMAAMDTARKMEALPQLKQAADQGKVSAKQAQAIASAASADPSAEQRLLELAQKQSLKELREEADRIKAAADRDAEARRKRIHAERSVRSWTDAQGVGVMQLRDNPERVAQVMAGLARRADEHFAMARKEGRQESPDAYLADALVDMVCGSPEERANARRTSTTKVIVRVDLDALLRGWVHEGETCELSGYGPVAVSAVEEMIASGALLAAVAARGTDLVAAVHLKRKPTAVMETALQWLYPTCAVEGCGQVGRLQKDHRDDWARTKLTFFLGLDLLCPHHHRLKTTKNWQLVAGSGKRAFVAPEDPRHPNRAHAPPDAA
jgi:hypothetical protein